MPARSATVMLDSDEFGYRHRSILYLKAPGLRAGPLSRDRAERSSASKAHRRRVPERCPTRPSASGFAFWSPPKARLAGAHLHRVPSIDSTNQRPDSTEIHCGFGFACQSPYPADGEDGEQEACLAGEQMVVPLGRGLAAHALPFEVREFAARLVAWRRRRRSTNANRGSSDARSCTLIASAMHRQHRVLRQRRRLLDVACRSPE